MYNAFKMTQKQKCNYSAWKSYSYNSKKMQILNQARKKLMVKHVNWKLLHIPIYKISKQLTRANKIISPMLKLQRLLFV